MITHKKSLVDHISLDAIVYTIDAMCNYLCTQKLFNLWSIHCVSFLRFCLSRTLHAFNVSASNKKMD